MSAPTLDLPISETGSERLSRRAWGTLLVLCGAMAGMWVLWTVGIVLVLGSLPASAPPA